MNRFYFSDKGVTRKLNCPNLWPVHDRRFSHTPKHIFAEPGLVVHIEPKICGGIAMAKIAIFNAASVQFKPYRSPYGELPPNYPKEYMSGGCVMNAQYFNNGDVIINANIIGCNVYSPEELEAEWLAREACIPALKQAVNMFLEYFPKV